MSISKRSSFAALAIGLSLVAASCSSDSKTTPASNKAVTGATGATTPDATSAATTPATDPKTTDVAVTTPAPADGGGTVTYAAEQEFTSYNNSAADQGLFANTLVLNMVQPGPFISQPDLSLSLDPALMVSAEVTSTDPQVVEYVIQPDAVWSDGEPIDCKDFLLSYMSGNGKVTKPNPDFGAPVVTDADGAPVADYESETLPVFNTASTTGYEDMSKVECSADMKTVTATFDKVYVDWNGLFAPLLPAHIVEKGAGVADLTKVDPVTFSDELEKLGTFWNEGFRGFNPDVDLSGGWYTIDSFTEGSNLILKRNEKYYGTPGLVDQIVFLQVPDATAQPAALENGDVQVISPQPNTDLVAQLKALTGVTTTLSQGVTFEHYDFNQANVHLADVNVRKALSLCIDRQEIVDTLSKPINPNAEVLNNRMYIPTQTQYKDNSGGLKRDIPAAKALLEKSGYVMGADGFYAKDGNKLSLRLGRRDPNPRRQSTNELFAEQCKEAGIELTDDPAADMNSVRLPASDYDIILFAWVATPFQSSNTAIYSPPGDGGGQNYNNYSNPAIKDLFAQANGEFDAAKRADLMNQIDQLLWDDMVTLPLFQFNELTANSDSVTNVKFNGPLGPTWNANEWAITAS